ncbi:hypothetical protein ACFY3V_19570 [Streptosporangium sp. NPDC000095]|uniref:hypothetical protein n=1 Tax=Streptosporangium sp. NPDC000095 TaxID=3366184 RepID=UPI0036B733A1
MASRHLYDLLEAHWGGPIDTFAAVWSEGLSVEETASRIEADLNSAYKVTLANLAEGFEGDQIPDDYEGIVLIGEFESWSLTLQVQWLDVTEKKVLSTLSRDGGCAIGINWHSGGDNHRIFHAVDGLTVDDAPMMYIPESLKPYAHGLTMPEDWDVPVDQGSPTEEMVTTSLILIGRIVGREIDQEWLEVPHMRFIIRRNI